MVFWISLRYLTLLVEQRNASLIIDEDEDAWKDGITLMVHLNVKNQNQKTTLLQLLDFSMLCVLRAYS